VRAIAADHRDRGVRARVRLLEPVAVSAGALVATTPITFLLFGVMTPAALLANLPAVPIAAAAVPAVALALLLGALGWDGGAALVAAGAGLMLDGLELTARAAAAWPWAQVQIAGRVSAAAAALLAALVLLAPYRRSRVRRAGAQAAARAALALAAIAAAMGSAVLAERAVMPDGGSRLTLHFLAVGQGDAALLRTPRGHWIAVDAGPRTPGYDAGRRRVVPFLQRQGVVRLSVLVATHGDADHLGGVPAVLDAVPAELVLEPGEPLGRPLYREFLTTAARRSAKWHAARAGDSIALDGVVLRVWHPDSAWLASGAEANESSVVLTVEYGEFRALLTGDAGLPMEALRAGAIGDVTLLKVGHHGSRSATGTAWLAAVRPEVCVVSVGQNRYGHPHPAVMARLSAARCATWRTDRLGDVTVETDGRTVRLRAAGRDTTFIIIKEQP
jgi:competence protein ComEC